MYLEFCVQFFVAIYRVIQEESAVLWEMIVCVILSKTVHMNMGRFWTVTEIWQKEDTDHPASTNSNYLINNITTNITCMQILTIVLLMICNGQNPGSSTSGTSHNKFSKMPPPTSMHLWTRCRVLRVARRSSWRRSFIRAQALLMWATYYDACDVSCDVIYYVIAVRARRMVPIFFYHISLTVQNRTHVHMNFFA